MEIKLTTEEIKNAFRFMAAQDVVNTEDSPDIILKRLQDNTDRFLEGLIFMENKQGMPTDIIVSLLASKNG